MKEFITQLPGHLLYLAASIVFVAVSAIGQDIVMRLFPLFYPLRVSLHEREQTAELEKVFAKEIEALTVAEFVISVVAMVSMPFLNYKLLIRLLSVNTLAGDHLLFSGGGVVIFFSVVGGAFLVPFLTLLYIRARYMRTPELHWLYQRSEDQHGAIGRFLIGKSVLLAACIVVVPTFFVANSYTLVGAHRVEVPHPAEWNERLRLSNEQIVELRVVPRGKGRVYTVRYQDGTLLTSSDAIGSVGELAAYGRAPREAMEYLSEMTGLLLVTDQGGGAKTKTARSGQGVMPYFSPIFVARTARTARTARRRENSTVPSVRLGNREPHRRVKFSPPGVPNEGVPARYGAKWRLGGV